MLNCTSRLGQHNTRHAPGMSQFTLILKFPPSYKLATSASPGIPATGHNCTFSLSNHLHRPACTRNVPANTHAAGRAGGVTYDTAVV
ncbi:hypothetical protein BaRGS_00002865 [Batillaria attramentaria]|uniref:Uncharacterized protein n=1 Tax=Batillaria attramentaria TaxID=370345 RepID=A0ABD0M430_9CAEN